MSEEEVINCKVVVIGESGVGKTSIIQRFKENTFTYSTKVSTGANYYRKEIIFEDENKSINFEVWDTAGTERYRSLAKVFYKNAPVCVLVYDITKKKSFEELKNFWVKEIEYNTLPDTSKNNIYIIIVTIFYINSNSFGWK